MCAGGEAVPGDGGGFAAALRGQGHAGQAAGLRHPLHLPAPERPLLLHAGPPLTHPTAPGGTFPFSTIRLSFSFSFSVHHIMQM